MASAGWYPDPGGAPGRYRYWDGQQWSAETVTDPGRGAPGAPGPAASVPPTERGRRRRAGPWIAALALLVVLAVVIALVVRSGTRSTTDPGPLPTSSVSGGNDASPSLTPSPTPSPSPTPNATPSSPDVPCPVGDPLARQDHPADGRIHGGGLSMPAQPGWSAPGRQVTGFSWAYDVGETDTNVQPRWFAAYAVGALSVVDGFEAPRMAAELAMACTTGSYFYKNVTGRRDVSSEAVTVGGHRGWSIRSEIRVDTDETTFEGDVVQITVVDVDAPESLAFFWGCAPIGDAPLLARLDATAGQLRAG